MLSLLFCSVVLLQVLVQGFVIEQDASQAGVEIYNHEVGEFQKFGNVNDSEIRELASTLFENDVNNLGKYITFQIQNRAKDKIDQSPNPLLKLSSDMPQPETLKLMRRLQDSYKPDQQNGGRNDLDKERKLIADFYNSLKQTPLVRTVGEFLVQKKVFQSLDEFNTQMLDVWFTFYPNPQKNSRLNFTSGFTHVFLAELESFKIDGFHNWDYFAKQEQLNTANYYGYIVSKDLGKHTTVLTCQFKWFDQVKPIGGFFIGTSPEFEMAVYSLCFFTRRNGKCGVKLNGHYIEIVNYATRNTPKQYVATAYPAVPKDCFSNDL